MAAGAINMVCAFNKFVSMAYIKKSTCTKKWVSRESCFSIQVKVGWEWLVNAAVSCHSTLDSFQLFFQTHFD
jgi:hypothetical protein